MSVPQTRDHVAIVSQQLVIVIVILLLLLPVPDGGEDAVDYGEALGGGELWIMSAHARVAVRGRVGLGERLLEAVCDCEGDDDDGYPPSEGGDSHCLSPELEAGVSTSLLNGRFSSGDKVERIIDGR